MKIMTMNELIIIILKELVKGYKEMNASTICEYENRLGDINEI